MARRVGCAEDLVEASPRKNAARGGASPQGRPHSRTSPWVNTVGLLARCSLRLALVGILVLGPKCASSPSCTVSTCRATVLLEVVVGCLGGGITLRWSRRRVLRAGSQHAPVNRPWHPVTALPRPRLGSPPGPRRDRGPAGHAMYDLATGPYLVDVAELPCPEDHGGGSEEARNRCKGQDQKGQFLTISKFRRGSNGSLACASLGTGHH